MKASVHRMRTRFAAAFGLLLLGAALCLPAAAQWGVYNDYTASYELVATIAPSQAAVGDVVWISYSGVADPNGSYEVLFSSANSPNNAVAIGTGYGSQIEVVVPKLPPGPAGVEVTAVSDGSVVLSTDETALLIVAAAPTVPPTSTPTMPPPTSTPTSSPIPTATTKIGKLIGVLDPVAY